MNNEILMSSQLADFLASQKHDENSAHSLTLRVLFTEYMQYLIKKMNAHDEAWNGSLPYAFLLWQLNCACAFMTLKQSQSLVQTVQKIQIDDLEHFEKMVIEGIKPVKDEIYQHVLTRCQQLDWELFITKQVVKGLIAATLFITSMAYIATAVSGNLLVILTVLNLCFSLMSAVVMKNQFQHYKKPTEVDPVYLTTRDVYITRADLEGEWQEKSPNPKIGYKLGGYHLLPRVFKAKQKFLKEGLNLTCSPTNIQVKTLCKKIEDNILSPEQRADAEIQHDTQDVVSSIVESVCLTQYQGVYQGKYYRETATFDEGGLQGVLRRTMPHVTVIDSKTLSI